MRSRLVIVLAAVLAAGLVAAPALLRSPRAGAAVHGLSVKGLNKIQRRILSGFASYEAGIGVPKATARARTGAPMRAGAASSALCPGNFGSNVLVNQN